MRHFCLVASTVLLLGGLTEARAQVCSPDQIQTSLQRLRRISFDLLGKGPDITQLQEVVSSTQIDEAMIDGMLTSDDFRHQIRNFVKDLLWANIRQSLSQGRYTVVSGQSTNFPSPAYWLPQRSRFYRGGNGTITCKDEEATFDANGRPITTPGPLPGTVQEGWVWVNPYWDPANPIQVCAFDASTVLISSQGNDCAQAIQASAGGTDLECGCGPNLSFCFASGPGLNTQGTVNEAIIEQAMRFVDRILSQGRPYSDLILGSEIEINGPLSHYLRFQTGVALGSLHASADQGFVVPQIPFTETETWTEVTRDPSYRHAGILTSFFYLLKFGSNRSRVNRFYNAFLCSYFEAPNEGLPNPNDPCNEEPNLTERCGCRYCHQVLDRDATYWGRWAEAGIMPLLEPEYPDYDESCANGPPFSRACRDFYFTEANHPDQTPYVGMLKSFVFADDYNENIQQGPLALAQSAVDTGRFAECTAQNIMTRLWARRPSAAEQPLVDQLSQDFIASGYDLRTLVKAIVLSPQYMESKQCIEEEQ